jgi:hypothetical protein
MCVLGRSKLSSNGAVIACTTGRATVGAAVEVVTGAPASLGVLFPGGTQAASETSATVGREIRRERGRRRCTPNS